MINILDRNRKNIVYCLFILLFVVAPFYHKGNLGGTGLGLPYNITVWAAVSTIIFYSIIILIIKKEIVFVDKIWMILSFPVLIIISSFFSGYLSANDWLIRQYFIFGGLLFLIALFQLRLKQPEIENILMLVVLSMIFHAGISVLQIIDIDFFKGIIPPKAGGSASGILQQTNVQASYLATGIIISFYLIARPSCKSRNGPGKTIIILAILFCSFALSNSGSRIGVLSLLAGLFLLTAGYSKEYLKNKNMIILALIALVLGAFLGRSGLGTAIEKGHDVVQGGYADLRMVIYSISITIAQAEFIWGHGLGSFVKAWSQYAPQFYASHPDVQHVPYITHPHNELLLWYIETGLLGIIGIVLFTWKVIASLLKCGWKNGSGYLAMLIPISLHTQVELPFYISSLHWFLWLFLIFMVLQSGGIKTKIIPAYSTKLIIATSMLYGLVLFFIYDCEMARRDFYDTIKHKNLNKYEYPLQVALNNLYFQSEAERLAMRSLLYVSIKNNDKHNIGNYVEWAEGYIKAKPELKIHEDMSKAYTLLNMKQKKCQVVKDGLYIYEESDVLLKNSSGC